MRRLRFISMLALTVCLALAFGSPRAAWAKTIKSNISKDTTWRLKKSPYVVSENIMLEEGATLTIERGVRVEFAAEVSLQIRGKFIAIGSPDKPIVFTAHDDEPWKNLYFTDFTPDAVVDENGAYVSGSIMKHCIVEKGQGVYVRFGAPLITECEIRDNFSSGIRVEFGKPIIVNNLIHDNSTKSESASGNGGGVIAYTDKPALIADNIIWDNVSDGGRDGGGGVYVYAVDGAEIVVRNNEIYGNSSSRFGGGIYAFGGIVEGNIVIGNKAVERGGGIYAVESRVVGNLVQSNSSSRGGGMYAENGDVESNRIIRNTARESKGGAMYYFGSGRVIGNNFISNAAPEGGCGGIYVSGNPEIRANNLIDNTGYGLEVANVNSAPEVSAAENYWGVDAERAILNLVFDWLDTETTGLANYIPYLEKMSSEAPPSPPFNLMAAATSAGIKLSWETPAGAPLNGHKIHVGTKSGYPYERVIPVDSGNAHEIKGLKRGTEYWVAVSSHGPGAGVGNGFSNEIRVIFTGSAASGAAPKSLEPAGADVARTAVLKASEPAPGATASRWQISTRLDDFTALAVDTTVEGGNLSTTKLAEASLIGAQEYHWRVAYRASGGSWSAWSEPTSFTTAADDPSLICGPIASVLTLEKRLSPYTIIGNTLVTSTGRLNIEPGVETRVMPGKNLMIRGNLVARGSDAEPIKFTSQGAENWGQIIFADQSADSVLDDDGAYTDGCILENCVIEKSKGLLVQSSSPLIKDCEISNNSGSGITVRQGGPVIKGNDIHHNTALTNGGGVYAYTNDIIFVTGNKIHDNTADGDGGGVYAYGYMNTSTIRIEDNEIADNSATGDGGGVYLSRSSALGNKITSNVAEGNGGGIYTTLGLVDDNELRGNKAEMGGGIFAERNSSLTGNLVASNEAHSGFGGGVYINFWGMSIDNEVFTKNTVTENSASVDGSNGGVFIVGYLRFEQNNIYANAGSQLYNGNEPEEYELLARHCYWGSSDSGEVAKLIVDGADDPELGKVSFEPFSPEPLKFN